MNNRELYHYGVLGMKWGVRKDRSSGGASVGKTDKKPKSTRAQRKANRAAVKKAAAKQKAEAKKRRMALLEIEDLAVGEAEDYINDLMFAGMKDEKIIKKYGNRMDDYADELFEKYYTKIFDASYARLKKERGL